MKGRFPKADAQLVRDLAQLGKARLSQHALLTGEQLSQSVQAAVVAVTAGISVDAVLDARTHICGPVRRKKK